MVEPATSGQLRTDIADMQIGDYIVCGYTAKTSGVAGIFSNLGSCTATEIPVSGTANPDGLFCFFKADSGLLIADRVVQTNISWDTLNTANFIQGKQLPLAILCGHTFAASVWQYGLGTDLFTGGHWGIDYNSATSRWLNINYNVSVPLGSVEFTWRAKEGYTPPKQISLYGSSTGKFTGEELLLGQQSNSNYTTSGTVATITIPRNQSFQCYRLVITSNAGEATDLLGITLNGVGDLLIRSITGGCAYLDTTGGCSLTDKSLGGWPVNNEWDNYIVNSSLGGKIISGDDNIWRWSSTSSLCMDTAMNGVLSHGISGSSSYSTTRGYLQVKDNYIGLATAALGNVGFRPVVEYPEDTKCTNLWY